MNFRKYPPSVKPGIPKLGKIKTDWSRLLIGELFVVRCRPVDFNENGIYELVTVKRSRGGVVPRSTLEGSKIGVKKQFYLEAGDFLISKRQIVHGACGFVPAELDGAIVSSEYSVLNCSDKLDKKFLAQLIHTPYFQRTCFHSSVGVHIEKMIFRLDDWFKWKIDLPSLAEQKKIADFLGAVDEKITLLRKKRELLERYKRGLMQKLFAQELRFRKDDGSPFPNWEEKKFGEVGRFIGGGTPSTGKARYWTGDIPWVSSSDIKEDNVRDITITRFISRIAIKESATKIVPANSILLVSRVGVGKLAVTVQTVCTSQDFANFTPYLDNVYFLAFFLLKNKKTLLSFSQGTSIKGFTMKDVSSLNVKLPKLIEQEKIAVLLYSLSEKLELILKRSLTFEKFKIGLLQKMFV